MKLIPTKLKNRLRARKQLRSATDYHFAISSRIQLLDLARWRAVVGEQSFFFSPEYLAMLEAAGPEGLEPRYALIADDERPLAVVCMQIVRVSLAQLGDHHGDNPGLKSKVAQRVLVGGNLLSYGMHAVCFAEGADRTALWPAVAEVLYRVRREEKLSGQTNLVVIKDFGEAEKQEAAALAGLSYTAIETEPNMVLTLPDHISTHADYLASLTSKYRSSIKQQVMKPFEAAGYTLEVLNDVASAADRLQALYLAVHENASLRPFTLDASYWPALKATAGPQVTFHIARKEGGIDGFVATLRDGPVGYVYHIGFNRDVANQGVPLYLRLLHAALAQAIDYGCRRISFGRTALEPKARLGCQPEPTHVWLRHRQPLLNQVMRPLLRRIQHEEAPEYQPFKKTSGQVE